MNDVTISIITVHKDQFGGLARTFRSVQALCKRPGVQWVVIDGASVTDTSARRELVDSVQSVSDVFLSEPDSGIYEAMNKGVELARGQYLLFLNAGDCLHRHFDPAQVFGPLSPPGPDMVWGRYDESGRRNQRANIAPRGRNWAWWGMPVSHQAILFRRESLGDRPYDETLKIAGDYDLLLRLLSQGASVVTTPVPICVVDGAGISNTAQLPALAEQMAVRKRYYGTFYPLNLAVSAAHLAVAWTGRFGSVRKLWK